MILQRPPGFRVVFFASFYNNAHRKEGLAIIVAYSQNRVIGRDSGASSLNWPAGLV